MRLSFIVPLYNCLPLTQAMLASLHATLPSTLEHEILLVDDGSTDGTRDWLRTLDHPAVRVLLNERNVGYAGANNRAAAEARGDFLALLNSDLVLTPGWLEPMLTLNAQLGNAAGAAGNVQLNATTGAVDHAGIYVTVKGKPEHLTTIPRGRDHAIMPAVTGACMLVARELWEKLGGFDVQFVNGGEDVDFCFRAGELGLRHAVTFQSVIKHHVSASPGRKEHDERNSYRLTLRWRQKLIELGARAWCRHHIRRTPYREIASLPAILLYLAKLRSTPPRAALRGVEKNIEHSLGIWTKRFGPLS